MLTLIIRRIKILDLGFSPEVGQAILIALFLVAKVHVESRGRCLLVDLDRSIEVSHVD